MSINIADNKIERLPILHMRRLSQRAQQSRTLQKQGSQAIRLAVIEGYMKHVLTLSDDIYAQFVEIEAPDNATIMVGSLTSSAYMVSYNVSFPADDATIYTMDANNEGFGGVIYTTWMTQSLSHTDVDYSPAYYFGDVADNQLPSNRIRVGSRVNLRQGLWTTANTEVHIYYQLRMTMGWS